MMPIHCRAGLHTVRICTRGDTHKNGSARTGGSELSVYIGSCME